MKFKISKKSILILLIVIGFVVGILLGRGYIIEQARERREIIDQIIIRETGEIRIPNESEQEKIRILLLSAIEKFEQKIPNLEEKIKQIEVSPTMVDVITDQLQMVLLEEGIIICDQGLKKCCSEELTKYLKAQQIWRDYIKEKILEK